MRCGAARVDITPVVGSELWNKGIYLSGYVARSGAATGVLQPVYARAMILQSGAQSAVIVSLEIMDLSPVHATALRGRISRELAVDAGAVSICSTHTHYAPAVFPLVECGAVSPEYLAWLDERIIEAVRQAMTNMKPAHLSVGWAPLDIACNRRAAVRGDRGGADGMSPRDTQVRALSVKDDTGRLVAVLFHYACHPVSMRSEFNEVYGDFPGVAASLIEQSYEASVAIFINGCAGDINPQQQYCQAPERTRRAGQLMADAVASAVDAGSALGQKAQLQVGFHTIELPTAPPDSQAWEKELASVRGECAKVEPAKDALKLRMLSAHKNFLQYRLDEVREGRYPATIAARVQIIRIGALNLIAMSGEVLYEIGQSIIEGYDAKLFWPVAYANGTIGYVSTRRAYGEGGYEPVDSCWYYNRPFLSPASADVLIQATRGYLTAMMG